MIDTRKLSPFLSPDILIQSANNFPDFPLSDWQPGDKKVVITKVLTEHILAQIKDKANIGKLLQAASITKLKPGAKFLILSDTFKPQYFLFEPLNEQDFRLNIGLFNSNSEILPSATADFEIGNDFLHTIRAAVHKDNSEYTLLENKIEGEFSEAMISAMYGAAVIYLFLLFVEIEIVMVQPGEKFKPKKYEGFKNSQKYPIPVADISWSREVVNNIPFGVTGHFRIQPVGEGRKGRKLIFIEPFLKSGYVRKSGKERNL